MKNIKTKFTMMQSTSNFKNKITNDVSNGHKIFLKQKKKICLLHLKQQKFEHHSSENCFSQISHLCQQQNRLFQVRPPN